MIPEFGLRRELARIRTGSCDLRIETGRWTREQVQDRLCCICAQEVVETEGHFLLECWPYEDLRKKMFASIRYQTGDAYGLTTQRDQTDWLVKVLLGLNGVEKRFQSKVAIAVAKFVRKAMKRRADWLM